MTMPINLVFVRHGQSEGNLANELSRAGDNSLFTEEFLNRHSSTWDLTKKGKAQAGAAGAWIKENIGIKFHRYYVSEYVRAMRTAEKMNLPNAEWMVSDYLRERDMGDLDVMPDDLRRKNFAESLRRRVIDPHYWIPDNGESMPTLCLRLEKIFDTLHRECSDGNAIVVVHGDVMWAARYILERMRHADILRIERSTDPHDKIYNCQILHYSRINPITGEKASYLNWMRSVCPTDPNFTLSSNEWREIVRRRFSNADLRQEIENMQSLQTQKGN